MTHMHTDPRTTEQKAADQSALDAALGLRPLVPSHTTCARPGCGHAADEHSRVGGCTSLAGNTASFCNCEAFALAEAAL